MHSRVGRYTGNLSYPRYLVDTGIMILVLTLHWYTVNYSILKEIPVLTSFYLNCMQSLKTRNL